MGIKETRIILMESVHFDRNYQFTASDADLDMHRVVWCTRSQISSVKNHGNPFHQRKIYRFLIVFNVVNGGYKVLDQSDLRQRRPNQTWCFQRHEGFKSIPEAEIHFAIYGYFFVFSSVRMLLLIVSQ